MTSPLLSPGQLWLGVVKGSDEEAFERLLSTMLKPGIDPKGFMHGEITQDPESPEKVTTKVSVQRARADISLWPYTDDIYISYRRVSLADMSEYFGEVIRTDLPTTIRELLGVFFNQHHLHDRSDQFEDAVISDLGVVTVNAIPGMVFVEGSTQFTVKPFQRHLTEVVEVTTVPGFREAAQLSGEELRELIDQVSAANTDMRYPLEFDMMSFSPPTKVSGYAYDNTTITISADGDGFYKGSTEITYTRYDFGWSSAGSQHYVEGPSVPTTQFIINRVSAITGFPIVLDDVVVETYPAIATGNLETLTIFFKSDSYRYTGELTIDYKAV